MRLLVVSPSFPPAADGEAEHCLQMAERLAALGHSVSVLTRRREGLQPAPTIHVDAAMPGWRWRHLPWLLAMLVRRRPDAVVLIFTARMFDEHPMITFLPTLLRWLRPRARLLVLVEIHRAPYIRGAAARLGRKLFAWLAGRRGVDYGFGTLLRDAHVVAALGPTILDQLRLHDASVSSRSLVMPPPPLVTRPRHVDAAALARIRAGFGVAPQGFLLAYFGFVYPGKGVETLLASVRELVEHGRSVWLVMVGGGRGVASATGGGANVAYEAEMVALAQRLGIADRVIWPPGYSGGSDGAGLQLLAADAAVLPFDDGAELRRSSIAVAVSMGLPLVTTQPAATETAFVDEGNVLLVAPRDAAALCVAIGRLIDDVALRRRLGAAALDMANAWFSWDEAIVRIAKSLEAQAA
jgi:glycosyltransferase involved in cell wall biosynthesis